jgi:hypothetical protein
VTDTHASACAEPPSRIVVDGASSGGSVGSNLTTRARALTATHSVVVGQETAVPWLLAGKIGVGVGVPGAFGLNVTCSPPAKSMAVHWLVEGHDTPFSELPLSMVETTRPAGADGLNVTARPASLTAVHWVSEGQEIAFNDELPVVSSWNAPLHVIGAASAGAGATAITATRRATARMHDRTVR